MTDSSAMRRGAIGLVVLIVAFSRVAFAVPPVRAGAPAETPKNPALKGRIGVAFAKHLIESDDANDRLRGVERLGAIGTQEAIDVLVEAVEQGAAVGRDPRARLVAVRVLAPHAGKDGVRQLLLREINDAGSEARGSLSPLAPLLRGSAALALARAGDKKALVGLLGAVAQGGASGEAARRALKAYPPASVDAFLEGRKRLTPELAKLLGELGDVRAVDRLRAMLAETDPAARTAAAIALARLGDDAALAPAREWMKTADPKLRRAAAEVLVDLGSPEAAVAVATLVAGEPTREAGLKLAALAPSPELVTPLLAALGAATDEQKPPIIALLGRSGARAVPPLAGLVARDGIGLHAAFALARAPGDEARHALEAAALEAKSGAVRRLVARASIVRALELDDAPAGLGALLDALAVSADAADRDVGFFGLVATGRSSASHALARACPKPACADDLVGAVARGELARGGSDLDVFAPRLEGAAGARLAAAGAALLVQPNGGAIATSVLADWAEGGGPIAPLAARALPSRDTPILRGRIRRLLEGSDPVVRAHVALGLANDPETDAVSLLVAAYRFEDDAEVRRAVVRALSHRSEVQRTATLELARDLDADESVRALAKAALAGRLARIGAARPSGGAPMTAIAWIAAQSNDVKPGAAQVVAGRLLRADGLAVPFVTDADGTALIPGVPAGPANVWLTPVVPLPRAR